MSNILTREQAFVKKHEAFRTRTPRIIEVPSNWDTLTPREKQIVVGHRKNMNSLLN